MNSHWLQIADLGASGLLNGVVQGVVVTVLVWVGLWLIPRTNAATRHAVWLLTLGIVLVIPAVHCVLPANRFCPPALRPTPASADRSAGPLAVRVTPAPESEPAESLRTLEPAPVGGLERPEKVGQRHTEAAFEQPAERSGDGGQPTFSGSAEIAVTDVSRTPPEGPTSSFPAIPRVKPGSDMPAGFVEQVSTMTVPPARTVPAGPPKKPARVLALAIPQHTGFAVMAALALVAGIRLAVLIRQYAHLRRLKREAVPPAEGLRNRFDLLAKGRRGVRLGVAHELNAPLAVGFLHPVVLLPEHLEETLGTAGLDAVIRHEHAHIQRLDDWANLAQQLGKAIFWFHPAVFWIARRLAIEREIACDDHVLHSGQRARDYALLLTGFASRNRHREWTAAPAAWSRKSQLTERINMILNTNRSTSPSLAFARFVMLGIATVASAALIAQAAPRVSLETTPITAGAPSVPVLSADAVPTVAAAALPAASQEGGTDATTRIPKSGPRAKDTSVASSVSAAAPAPEPAIPPIPPVAPLPPVALQAPAAPPAVVSWNQNAHLEERLARVEQMLASLLSHSREASSTPAATQESHPAPKSSVDCFETATSEDRTEAASQNAKAAQDQWVLQQKRVELDAKHGLSQAASEKALDQRRRSLETQRQAIEKQVEALQQQLDQLEQEQDKLDQEQEKLDEAREKTEQELEALNVDTQ